MSARNPWWIDAVGYQIYPRSFCDSNGDGIGDIPGIITKLDHLQALGIGFVWLSPVYRSPMADNGYDIADYQDIAPEFGTLDDLDHLIEEARTRGIGVVMDLVVNHTSDEHPWFEASRASRHNPKRDFYIWRDPAADGGPPDERRSYFGGPAWSHDAVTGQYYFHLFDRKQPDLDWSNPEVRKCVYEMMNWWLDRGLAGFRMDVIDLIGKDVDAGLIEEGPHLHTYLQEMHRETLAGRAIVTVGESWNASPETALLYSGRDRNELSMIFQFEHITQQWDDEHGKWKPKPFDLVAFKRVLNKWQLALADDGWNSLFLNNHDLPRAVSRYGDDGRFHGQSAKMLATTLHFMKGTPFIYQGEEIGMTNAVFSRIDQFRDVETLRHYEVLTAAGVSHDDFIAGANANGRDNARTPMQWSDAPNAGFTTGTPWIEVNPNHKTINVERQERDPHSILAHYKRLVALRKKHPIIVHGRYRPHLEDHPQLMVYERTLEGERLVVIATFSAQSVEIEVPPELEITGECLISNEDERSRLAGTVRLSPYEAFAIHARSG